MNLTRHLSCLILKQFSFTNPLTTDKILFHDQLIEKFYMLAQHFEMVDFNSFQLRVHLDTESTIGYSMDKVVWIIQAQYKSSIMVFNCTERSIKADVILNELWVEILRFRH